MDQDLPGDRPLPVEQGRALPPARVPLPAYPAPHTYMVVNEPEPRPIGIGDFLRRRLWTIVAAVAVVLPLTAVFTATRPTIYRSSSTFLVEASQNRSNTPPLEVLARAMQLNTMTTEAELMTSRRVAEPAVRALGLHVRVERGDETEPASRVFPTFSSQSEVIPGTYRIATRAGGIYEVRHGVTGEIMARTEPDSVLQFAGISLSLPADPDRKEYVLHVSPVEGWVGGAKGSVKAEPLDRDSDILQLTCSGSSPQEAQELCEAVGKSYLDLRSEMQRAEASAAVQFLEEQLDQVAVRLEAAEDSLRDYQQENLAVALDAQAGQEVGQHGAFRAQRDELVAQRAALRQLIDQIESAPGGQGRDFASLPTFIQSGNPVIGNLLGSLVDLENRRAELLKTRTERNPDVVAIDTRITEIETQLRSMATNYDSALTAQISSLGGIVGQATGRMAAIPAKQVETARLMRQVTLLDEAYRGLKTQLRDAHMAESITLPTVRILDRPTKPGRPVSPNWPFNMALGVVLGIAFGLAVALWQDYSDTRIRERKDLEQETGVPVLAMLPRVRDAGPILPVSRPGGNGMIGGGSLVKTGDHHEQDITREAFWSLVTDLQFAARRLQNGGLRSLAITSTTRGEGKTFSACNLALAQANLSMRTLLIDADVRGKGATRFFGIKMATPGLTDVIAGSIRPRDAWRPLTVDGRGELYVLPAGSLGADRREPLEMEELAQVLSEAKREFDLVVVDTPPLNIVSDAATVAASVDGVIVVVRGGLTDRAALDFTLDRLRRTKAEIMGLVLNDVELPGYYTSYSHAEVEDEARS